MMDMRKQPMLEPFERDGFLISATPTLKGVVKLVYQVGSKIHDGIMPDDVWELLCDNYRVDPLGSAYLVRIRGYTVKCPEGQPSRFITSFRRIRPEDLIR